jgi:hypothetical protein
MMGWVELLQAVAPLMTTRASKANTTLRMRKA